MKISKDGFLSWITMTVLMAAVGVLLLAGVGIARYGSVSASLAAMRGRGIIADATTKSIGDVREGQYKYVKSKLNNITSGPVRIVGSQSSCSCTIAENALPMIIGAGSDEVLNISVHVPSQPTRFEQIVVLFTDKREQPYVRLRVTGNIRE